MNLGKDLVSSKRAFEVEVSEQCADEIIEIYGYISNVLKEKRIARKMFV